MSQSLSNSTAGLYNTLCDALKLSNQQFQMIQGTLPVQTNPADIYNYVDAIPPVSIATLYTNNPVNGLNSNMQITISEAMPSFLSRLFENNYFNPKYWVDGNIGVDPIYSPPLADMFNQVNSGSSAKISFDSAKANSDINTSWAKSTSSAGLGFWGTSSSSVSESLNAKASSSRITVDIEFDKYSYLQVRAGGWFTQGFCADQYRNPSKWFGGQDARDKVFGATGSCPYIANQLLLVNGYTITVTSHASYSESDFRLIQQSKETNVWPFYTDAGNSIATSSYNLNQDYSITAIVRCKPGSLQIFGVSVISSSLVTGMVGNSRLI